MLLHSMMMTVILSMVAVMMLRWVLGRHMLAAKVYRGSTGYMGSQGYYSGLSGAYPFGDIPASGSLVINGRTTNYTRTTITGAPGTPAIAAVAAVAGSAGTPGTPAYAGIGAIAGVPEQKEVPASPGLCSGYCPKYASGPNDPTPPTAAEEKACTDQPMCGFTAGQIFVKAIPEVICYYPCSHTCYETCTTPGACSGSPAVCDPDTYYDCNPYNCHADDGPWVCQPYVPAIPHVDNQCTGGPAPMDADDCKEQLGTYSPPTEYVPYRAAIPGIPGEGARAATPGIPAVPATPGHADILKGPDIQIKKIVFTSE